MFVRFVRFVFALVAVFTSAALTLAAAADAAVANRLLPVFVAVAAVFRVVRRSLAPHLVAVVVLLALTGCAVAVAVVRAPTAPPDPPAPVEAPQRPDAGHPEPSR